MSVLDKTGLQYLWGKIKSYFVPRLFANGSMQTLAPTTDTEVHVNVGGASGVTTVNDIVKTGAEGQNLDLKGTFNGSGTFSGTASGSLSGTFSGILQNITSVSGAVVGYGGFIDSSAKTLTLDEIPVGYMKLFKNKNGRIRTPSSGRYFILTENVSEDDGGAVHFNVRVGVYTGQCEITGNYGIYWRVG